MAVRCFYSSFRKPFDSHSQRCSTASDRSWLKNPSLTEVSSYLGPDTRPTLRVERTFCTSLSIMGGRTEHPTAIGMCSSVRTSQFIRGAPGVSRASYNSYLKTTTVRTLAPTWEVDRPLFQRVIDPSPGPWIRDNPKRATRAVRFPTVDPHLQTTEFRTSAKGTLSQVDRFSLFTHQVPPQMTRFLPGSAEDMRADRFFSPCTHERAGFVQRPSVIDMIPPDIIPDLIQVRKCDLFRPLESYPISKDVCCQGTACVRVSISCLPGQTWDSWSDLATVFLPSSIQVSMESIQIPSSLGVGGTSRAGASLGMLF